MKRFFSCKRYFSCLKKENELEREKLKIQREYFSRKVSSEERSIKEEVEYEMRTFIKENYLFSVGLLKGEIKDLQIPWVLLIIVQEEFVNQTIEFLNKLNIRIPFFVEKSVYKIHSKNTFNGLLSAIETKKLKLAFDESNLIYDNDSSFICGFGVDWYFGINFPVLSISVSNDSTLKLVEDFLKPLKIKFQIPICIEIRETE